MSLDINKSFKATRNHLENLECIIPTLLPLLLNSILITNDSFITINCLKSGFSKVFF